MLSQFPCPILGFHADNGSEYVNHRVAAMLEKLRIDTLFASPARSSLLLRAAGACDGVECAAGLHGSVMAV
jgi:transposase InsO family protein